MPHQRDTQPVAVVTGAGADRIGLCVVKRLVQRGYDIVIHANRSIAGAQSAANEINTMGRQALALQADLTDEQAVHQMAETVRQQFGRVDALVNCAAIWERKRLEDVTADDVRRHLDVNVLGTFLCCQVFGLIMVAQPVGGSIVNIGDWATARPYTDYAAYFPSKGSIPAMTRSLAVEFARRNSFVRVNAVLPGPVMLPADLPEAERRASIDGTLVKREGKPENVAHAVEFLLDNDFVTGICLPVDGGRTLA